MWRRSRPLPLPGRQRTIPPLGRGGRRSVGTVLTIALVRSTRTFPAQRPVSPATALRPRRARRRFDARLSDGFCRPGRGGIGGKGRFQGGDERRRWRRGGRAAFARLGRCRRRRFRGDRLSGRDGSRGHRRVGRRPAGAGRSRSGGLGTGGRRLLDGFFGGQPLTSSSSFGHRVTRRRWFALRRAGTFGRASRGSGVALPGNRAAPRHGLYPCGPVPAPLGFASTGARRVAAAGAGTKRWRSYSEGESGEPEGRGRNSPPECVTISYHLFPPTVNACA